MQGAASGKASEFASTEGKPMSSPEMITSSR